MNNYRIQFDSIPWQEKASGFRQKEISKNNKKLRLIEITPDFVESDWCTAGHVGYVIKGELNIKFSEKTIQLHQGDGLWIEAGELHKHKAYVEDGLVELLLFE